MENTKYEIRSTGKKLYPKEIKRKDVLIAVDISQNNIDFNNLKDLLRLFDNMTKDYDMKGSVITFDSKVHLDFHLEAYDKLSEETLTISTEKANFDVITNYIEDNKLDIFRIFVLTDGHIKTPKTCEYEVVWITDPGNEFNFGTTLKL